jgi:hypothetical protein
MVAEININTRVVTGTKQECSKMCNIRNNQLHYINAVYFKTFSDDKREL